MTSWLRVMTNKEWIKSNGKGTVTVQDASKTGREVSMTGKKRTKTTREVTVKKKKELKRDVK